MAHGQTPARPNGIALREGNAHFKRAGFLQAHQDFPPDAAFNPAFVAHKDHHPVAEGGRHGPPAAPFAQDIERSLQSQTVWNTGLAAASVFLFLKNKLNERELLVGQAVESFHDQGIAKRAEQGNVFACSPRGRGGARADDDGKRIVLDGEETLVYTYYLYYGK